MCAFSPDLNGPIFPLLDCWVSFSRSIINSVVPYKDKKAYEHCQNFIWLCLIADSQTNSQRPSSYFDEMLSNNMDFDSSTSTDSGVLSPRPSVATPMAMRRMLCHLLFAWVDSIQTVISDPFHVPVDPRLADSSSGK